MIAIEGLSFAYPGAPAPVLREVSLSIAEGEAVLVVGPSGSGKSTLLRCLNGLIPHFHGGAFRGRVVVDGQDTLKSQPRDLARSVGMVFQDPESQSVADVVEDEMAFGMENLGVPRLTMRKRVEEVLDVLGIGGLRRRRLDTLSGGELQRVAIGSVLTMQPRVLVLDEPTSQLDPQAAEEVLTAVQRLNVDLGLTVIIAEHRLERVVQYVDRVLYLPGDGSLASYDVREAMERLPLAPPVARLGRALGWSPVPLSVREGRRFVTSRPEPLPEDEGDAPAGGEPAVVLEDVCLSYGGPDVVRHVHLRAHRGQVLALMGRNGAGKTTLLRSVVGLLRPRRGVVRVLGREVTDSQTGELAREVALVPQDPASVLFHDSVEEEVSYTLRSTGRAGSVEEALGEWDLMDLRREHPRDLSAGERERAALATMLAGEPAVLLLDEPTRGMDYGTKELLVANLRRRCARGCAVVLASHDVELAARCAQRVALLAEGELVAEGPTRHVLTESLTFSTQVNKLFGGRFLTVEDVLQAVARGGSHVRA
ncbi:MAG: ATP-binding cassette domain-containing protein [Dehalococcoidia bacterium]